MNSHRNLVSSANWQSRDLHSSPVIFLRDRFKHSIRVRDVESNFNVNLGSTVGPTQKKRGHLIFLLLVQKVKYNQLKFMIK